ncbi:disulfide bond formation protein C [bacterium BMS3Abin02]|nr:disulfide bond formation protein C [bacterium BMS3Abin02]GBE21500.1 disulfide bond formation protein C [bacterium BMS3Bbin01]HDK46044.1 disulfide bond formation protein B [Actinomycetota bacterium]HDL50306.1 disulfide bond formation protein B [Actinomycetota bacterium]
MNPAFVNRFFGLITLLIIVVDIGLVVLLLGRRRSAVLQSASDWLDDLLGGSTLWVASAIALGAIAGSLFYSEVIGFNPCHLCWYQRIVWYPLVIVLPIAALRKDTRISTYSLPFVVVGWGIAAYQYTIQSFPSLDAGVCSPDVPCTLRWVWELGFISIPMMSLAGLTLVGLLLLWARTSTRKEHE